MIAYQVTLNGEVVSTAGLTEGVVSGIANWVFLPSGKASDPTDNWHASFSLGGLDHRTDEHLQLFRTNLKLGDEITLKLVEVEQVDSPSEPLFTKSKEKIKRILDEEFKVEQAAQPQFPGTTK
ncbi:hypothetical protein FEM03_16055 [Phragmitibacter flavus]|uniref:Uncharacterized protein n=1 Tax=Phragmitibacter flavus TaxID=2576071 RepID=A0A5R8KBY7_9BACT|nr:hypothetical protein [Phragmitibacter flavus]TLD69833.1 hypothetical protein FEM03_16055 [Phragmitibacter flavus]